MGLRFQKRIKIIPGVTLNLSKSGVSLSVGPRGAKINIGSEGVRGTVGIPGTGVSYTKKLVGSDEITKSKKSSEKSEINTLDPNQAPEDEKAFVAGLQAYLAGDSDQALEQLKNAQHHADGAFLAGMIALEKEQLTKAADALQKALDQRDSLGQLFKKYEVEAGVRLEITDEFEALIQPGFYGAALALAEVQQAQGQIEAAIQWLEQLYQTAPDDIMVRLSLAELLITHNPTKETYQRVMQLAEGITNETPIHTALLLYRARALRGLGLIDPAQNVLTDTLRRKKDRSPELVWALLYERALTYEESGDSKAARKDLEAVYTEAPTYEDVAQRLGLG